MTATDTKTPPGLERNAISFVSNVVIGVASTAPAHSPAATLGLIVAVGGIGLQSPAGVAGNSTFLLFGWDPAASNRWAVPAVFIVMGGALLLWSTVRYRDFFARRPEVAGTPVS